MTKEEIKKKTEEKVQAIKKLCIQLEMELVSKQMITENGFIENIIYFLDMEKYEVYEEPKK